MCPEIKYAVNEKKREVVAYTKGTSGDAVRAVLRRLPERIYFDGAYKGLMPDEFRITVKCDPEDVFDAEVGKKLARKRLLDNYWRSRHKAEHRIKVEIEGQIAKALEVVKDYK